MNLGLVLPEIKIAFWVFFSIMILILFILPSKFIKFKKLDIYDGKLRKDYFFVVGNILLTICYAVITSLFIIFFSSAGIIINSDFFWNIILVAAFIYNLRVFLKHLNNKIILNNFKIINPNKKTLYAVLFSPLIISFLVFYYLYNGDKIYKLSPHCQNTEDPKIKFCKYSNGTYTGEMKAFRRHGQGEYIWDSGKTYKGEWKNGKKLNQ